MYRVVDDPRRLDEVFVLADLTESSKQLEKMTQGLRDDPEMSKLLDAKPRLGHLDRDVLASFDEGTLGRHYGEFMVARGLFHENLTLIDGDDSDMGWMRNHLRETHDLWHVLTGFDTDVAGELGLQSFYIAQLEGPLPVLILAIGMLNTLFKEMDDVGPRMNAIVRGWVLGTRARSLFGLRFMDWMERPIADLRAEYGIDIEGVEEMLSVTAPRTALFQAA